MLTGTPWCSPTPVTETGRANVVSNRIEAFRVAFRGGLQVHDPDHLTDVDLWLFCYTFSHLCIEIATLRGLSYHEASCRGCS